MNLKHSIRFISIIFIISLLTLGGCIWDCDCDKRKRPLPTPSPPSDIPFTPPVPEDVDIRKPDWDIHSSAPWLATNDGSRAIGICDTVYVFEATAKQDVLVCGPMNFSPLYDRAKEVGEKYIANFNCIEDCPNLYTEEIDRKWDCTRIPASSPPKRIAYSAVTYEIKCIKDDIDDVRLPYPPQEPFDRPHTPESNLVINDTIVEDGDIDPLGCEIGEDNFQTKHVNFTENIQSDCTRDNWDFAPYIVRAKEIAKAHHSRQSCAPECVKMPFTTSYERWKCTNTNFVEIDIAYTLKCLPR